MTKRLLAIPGDGIGREVMPVAISVARMLAPEWEIDSLEAGIERFERVGSAFPEDLLARAGFADGVLFGCTGTPSPPPLGYESPILTLREGLGLGVNIRHCRSIDGRIDIMMVRDCSEGLYCRRERIDGDCAVAEHVVTRAAVTAICDAAADLAVGRKGRVTVVHKANVLKVVEGSFRRWAIEALEARGVKWEEALSDAAGYHIVLDPGRYDVMVMNSQVGDLLSDVGAAVVGGLGLVPSLSLGTGTPLAEPIHGSAPDLVGSGRADPIAILGSLALLLGHLGLTIEAGRLDRALRCHLKDRRSEPTTEAVAEDVMGRLLVI